MPNDTRPLRITGFRAHFTEEMRITFEDVLRQLDQKLTSHRDRTFQSRGSQQSIVISSFRTHPANEGIGLTLSVFEEGSEISILDLGSAEDEVTHTSRAAGPNEEFLDKNISLLAVGNCVVFCGLGKRSTFVAAALQSLATKAGIIHSNNLLGFSDLPMPEPMENIRKFGVRSVSLNATSLIGDLDKSLRQPLLNKLFGGVMGPETLKRRRENVLHLSLRSNGRLFPKTPILQEEQMRNDWLDNIAGMVLEDQEFDDFTIILNNNMPIRSGTLFGHQTVDIAKMGSSYDTKEAHQKMLTYYRTMLENIMT